MCGICDSVCNSEIAIIFHQALSLIRLHLLEEYTYLQHNYFEERTTFKYWDDYHLHYYNNYHVKFVKLMDGIMRINALTQDYILCTNAVMNQIHAAGCENLFPATLLESLLQKEKTSEEVSEELKIYIENKFFSKS